ncbi:hypothetical protein VTI74DRAFT_6553 [Chaetomium olivicolor]
MASSINSKFKAGTKKTSLASDLLALLCIWPNTRTEQHQSVNMENPARDIKGVIQSLTQGTPDEQRDAIYRYFAPGATFDHPFCRVPSFKKLHLPGVGELDSRALITAIYRW